MAQNSKIEWCDHTFNPWIGCTKVSQGCKNCYAERLMDHRWGKITWGPQGKRVRTAKAYWKQPLKWNETWYVQCDVCGLRQVFEEHGFCAGCHHPMVAVMKKVRPRVFCGSLCDVFEEKRNQMDEMDQWRSDLFELIEQTPNLDWLLLTKRPEHVEWMLEVALFNRGIDLQAGEWLKSHPNVWIGTSVENQEMADARIPALVRIPAKIHFVSVEPMLEKIDLQLEGRNYGMDYPGYSEFVHWVICGGESGPCARPLHPAWVKSIRDQCQEAGVPFFFKQWGEYLPSGDPEHYLFKKVGKHRSGRILDGVEWSQFPE